MAVLLTEIIPTGIRAAGFAFAHSCGTAIFGGFTPAISTYLIHVTGNRGIPGLWLSVAATFGLVVTALVSSSILTHPPALQEGTP